MRSVLRFTALMLALTATEAAADTNTASSQQTAVSPSAVGTLLDKGPVPLQGDCSVNALSTAAHDGANADLSTWSCTGLSISPLEFSYTTGLTESCLYIDNISPEQHAFFVPMRTDIEWLAFKQATQTGGSLDRKVSLTYGCNAETMETDACGAPLSLPAARNGTTITLHATPPGTLQTTYTCEAVSGCGAWTKTGEDGGCKVDGACGPSSGLTLDKAPATDLCAAGTPSAVAGSGPWSWTCAGLEGGTTTNCAASTTPHGTCGASNGLAFDNAPTSGLCGTGTPSAVAGFGPWSWTCTGQAGGSAECSANVTPCGGTKPVNLVIVLDASNSMQSLVDAAKTAIRTLATTSLANKPNVTVTLTVFGGQGYTPDPSVSKQYCAVAKLVGPAALDSPAIDGALNAVVAADSTPLASALTFSGKFITGKPNPAMIVLTDGVETCGSSLVHLNANVAPAIQGLKAKGVKLFGIAYGAYDGTSFIGYDSVTPANTGQEVLAALNGFLTESVCVNKPKPPLSVPMNTITAASGCAPHLDQGYDCASVVDWSDGCGKTWTEYTPCANEACVSADTL